MTKRTFYGISSKGRFIHKDSDGFSEFMGHFKEGEPMQITVSKERKLRTTGAPGQISNQNGYLFGIVLAVIGGWMGEENLHEVLKWCELECGFYKEIKGQKIPFETSKMERGEFQDMVNKIRIWANREHQLNIPEPHEGDDYGNSYL